MQYESRVTLGTIPSTQVIVTQSHVFKSDLEDSKLLEETAMDFPRHIINKIPRTWPSFREDILRDLEESVPERYDVFTLITDIIIGRNVKRYQAWPRTFAVPKWRFIQGLI